ncbi:hypothetical protein SAMN04487917_11417 [Arthrobacter sp. yr096]|uniref:hypothetical protein n=1 Tax=Arthrobacter sp. yr096 TaxID=1761750 RepID=UPI0008B1EE79|nr:hypothetical protein [Arthrobacter sp. yr096]SEJ79807.1 hypothetical protein SAMN04487917_11417 [Arthrobacter sp. yr096]
MPRRSWFLLAAFAVVLPLGAAPAVAADGEPSGWLELDAGPAGEVHRLTPGGSADWAVDVTVHGEPASSLEVGLRPEPAASEVLRDFLSVELRACSQPWNGGSCPGGQRTLMDPTALASAEGVRVDLLEPGTSSATTAHVLLTATLAVDAPREVQGSRTQIVVGVHGSGDGAGGAGNGGGGDDGDGGAGPGGNAGSGAFPGNPTGPSSGLLADTGARLGGFALLGLLAVAAGFGMARLRSGAR